MKIALTDICDFQGGTQPPKNEWIDHKAEGYVRMLQIRDFTQSEKENIEYVKDTKNLKKCNENDILIGRYGASVGKILTGLSGAYNVAIIKAIPDKDKLYARYLYYFFNSPYFQDFIKGVGCRAAQAGFNKDDLKNAVVPLLSIDEQRKVATVLDKVTSLIAKRRQQLDKLDEMVKARFVEMFGDPVANPMGWKQTTLKELAVGKLSYGSGASAVNYDGKVRYIRITDITDDGELNNDIKSPNQFDEKYLLQNGDILFARSGATVGKTLCYSQEKHGKAIYAGYLIRMIPDSTRVLPIYIFYYTKTSYYSSFISVAQKAVAQPNINAQEYGNLLICVPPLEVQNQFAAFVEQTEKAKTTISRSLDKLETLKKALMQEYFG